MRRLLALITAVSLVAGPLATAGAALGKEGREGRAEQRRESGREQGREQGQRGGRWNDGRGQGGPQQIYRGGEFRNEGRNEPVDPRGDYRGESRREPRIDPRYDPRTYGPPPGSYSTAPRRGGYLGPGAGEVIENPAGQRLRPAPRGYEWVRTARGNALVSRSTGQVFDVVPY